MDRKREDVKNPLTKSELLFVVDTEERGNLGFLTGALFYAGFALRVPHSVQMHFVSKHHLVIWCAKPDC